ncbi:MAG: carbohydrate binding family 9 domain-containing protein, partial [Gemmatimonadetes bacterium]|nr:carbohydrate binding family 9 domain-containing protein [Gemmatimonadota bacterium]
MAQSLSPEEQEALAQLGDDFATSYPLIDSWFEGRPIQYYHFGTSAPDAGSLYRVRGGGAVLSSIPGLPGYSALRQVYDVEILPSARVTPGEVRSHEQLIQLLARRQARLVATGLVLNLPIVPGGSRLENDPAQRGLQEASFKGRPVRYFDFGPNRALTIPLIVFAERLPTDPAEELQGVPGQATNASGIPGSPGYSDLWDLQVAAGSGYEPGSYRDYRRALADIRARKLMARPRRSIVNCPVVYVAGRPAARPSPLSAATHPGIKQATLLPPAPVATAVPGRVAASPAANAPPATRPEAAPRSDAASLVFSGIGGRTAVRAPRVDADAVIDGALGEAVWSQAAVLTGFSQFHPVDGRPANDSTDVLVWYSPRAIYFGIRAYEAHGEVHATLADRDKIGSDDYVQILLDTFNDRRRALTFGVNPLGVQSDGNLGEGSQRGGGGAGISGPSSASARDTTDLSADFTYQSKGRLTDYGYEVEVRIPFKSIRYQSEPEQTWGLNVVRRVQHSGYEDSWTPARRANASFLGQSGTLVGLRGLERGLVLEVNPIVTSRVTGTAATTGWTYDASRPEFGGNVRFGLTSNLTLNGTANPDFSQVEADVQQQQFDPRRALFYPEKRPFFLEGIEQFETPNQLIYTRRVVQPVGAAKLTGKAGGTTIGLLSAADDRAQSGSSTDYPIYNLLRLRQDLGRQSTAGLVYT